MATTNTFSTGNHSTKSELEKFTLFYESVPVKSPLRSKRQVQRSVER